LESGFGPAWMKSVDVNVIESVNFKFCLKAMHGADQRRFGRIV